MSIKFWEEKEDKMFVRFDRSTHDTGALVWLCSPNGHRVSCGDLVSAHGSRVRGVNPAAASLAGVNLDIDGYPSPDSLAQICAEMAKRIQND